MSKEEQPEMNLEAAEENDGISFVEEILNNREKSSEKAPKEDEPAKEPEKESEEEKKEVEEKAAKAAVEKEAAEKKAVEKKEKEEKNSNDEKEIEGELKPRFENLEDAEKSFKNAEAKMHEATQKAAELQRELDTAKEKGAKEPAKEEKQEPEEIEAAIIAKANEEISALDAEDEDYNKKVVGIIMKQNRRIAEEVANSREAKKNVEVETQKAVEARIEKEGLTEFAEEFWAYANMLPSDLKTFEERLDWVVEKTRKISSKADELVQKRIAELKKDDEVVIPRSNKGEKIPKAGESEEEEEENASFCDLVKALKVK